MMEGPGWIARWAAVAVIFGVVGCAQVGAPDGGGRDLDPPVVVAADPPFGTTGFDGTSFTLTFDEFVQLQDARRQMLVSPPLPSPPKAMVRGRTIRVDLGSELLPDRTYIVQFGDAVRDLREGNVAKGLMYVFSTGNSLDSGRVAGRAEDAWSGEPAASVRVLLYSDSLPEGILDAALPDSLRPLPDYVGLVDDSGRFSVDFLPEQVFGALVLDDVNANYRADQGEPVGWWETGCRAASDSTAGEGFSTPARLDAPPPVPSTYLSGMRVDSAGYWRAAVAGLAPLREGPDGMTDAGLDIGVSGLMGAVETGREGDSIWAVLPDFTPDNPGTWTVTHPSGVDTLEFRRLEPVVAPAAVGRPDRFLPPGGWTAMRFAPQPVGLDTGLCRAVVILEGDTLQWGGERFALEGALVKVGLLPEGARVEVQLEPGAVLGTLTTADTITWSGQVRRASDYGTVRIMSDSLGFPESVLWWLTDGDGAPMYDHPMDADGRFRQVLPGRYGLVRIVDLDGDGRWTGAHPARGIEPEPTSHLSGSVEVRAGWEIEVSPGFLPRP